MAVELSNGESEGQKLSAMKKRATDNDGRWVKGDGGGEQRKSGWTFRQQR